MWYLRNKGGRNEVTWNKSQNTTRFIGYVVAMVLIKQHVSAYMEAIIRFFLCWLQETINNAWFDVEISASAELKHYI